MSKALSCAKHPATGLGTSIDALTGNGGHIASLLGEKPGLKGRKALLAAPTRAGEGA